MNIKKSIIATASAVALVATIGAPTAFAAVGGFQQGAHLGACDGSRSCVNTICSKFVDENGDGICDIVGAGNGYGNGAHDGAGSGNGYGNGTCDGTGTGNGYGKGACDGTGPTSQGAHQQQHGHHSGR